MEFIIIIGAALLVLALTADLRRNDREDAERKADSEQAEFDRLLNN
jgi:hypothetical protein